MALLQSTDVTYLGRFDLPTYAGGTGDEWTMNYGGCGVGMGPSNTIFIGGHAANPSAQAKLARFTIPSLGGTATVVQNLTTVPGNFSDYGNQVFGGVLYYNSRVIATRFGYFETLDDNIGVSHTSGALNLTGWTTPQGAEFGHALSARTVAGFMGVVPSEWQSAFGGPCFIGSSARQIDANSSMGPCLYIFDPADVDGSGTIPTTECLYYDLTNQYLNEVSQSGGAAWVGDSVLFFGSKGEGPYSYGVPGVDADADPCNGNHGVHQYPYHTWVWAYSAASLLAQKDSATPWNLLPYANWRLRWTGEGDCNQINNRGGCYDPVTGRYYLCYEYGEDAHVLVFQIAQTGTPPTGTITLSVR